MNYLIFGGEGFIGTHVSQHIIKSDANANIYSIDLLKHNNFSFVEYIKTDVREPLNIQMKDDNSIIYNLAAVHKTPGHPSNEYFETNIKGAENICNFARQNNIETIVFTSSIAPYGASEDLKKETSVPMPNTPYGISKLTAEHIHKTWQAEKANTRKLVIVRPGVVFGKGEGGNFTRLYKSMKKGFFFYPGRKDTLKASVYVKDVARILYQTSLELSPGVYTFNLTYLPAPTIETICKTIAEVTGVKEPKFKIPGALLTTAAGGAFYGGKFLGKNIQGIHPDRVKKLMISTNISGENLANSPFALKYSLKEAVADWFEDCNNKELS